MPMHCLAGLAMLIAMSEAHFSAVELFTGAGGLALGIEQAGGATKLLLEYNRHACASLRRNSAFFGGDACTIHEGDVRGYAFRSLTGIDLLAAGAPCQPFSIGGKHRGHEDERNLFPQVFRAVREIEPRAVVVENVRGLLRPRLREFVEFIELQLKHPTVTQRDPLDPEGWVDHLPTLRAVDRSGIRDSFGYRVATRLVNAADYGVPQRRERVFMVALHRKLGVRWVPPVPTHTLAALQLAQQVTGEYWERHGVRRRVRLDHPKAMRWNLEAKGTKPWRTVRDALAGLPDPSHAAARSFANHGAQPGARAYPGHTGSAIDQPAKTLKAGVHGVPGGENMLRRPNGTVRYFTVREAARLQSFPDGYVFEGAWGEAMRQIGNAVPVKLAEAVIASIRSYLIATPAYGLVPLRAVEQPRDTQPELLQEVLPGFAHSL